MSDALSFEEIDGQHVELLPARTVMSAFRTGWDCGCGDEDDEGLLGGVLDILGL